MKPLLFTCLLLISSHAFSEYRISFEQPTIDIPEDSMPEGPDFWMYTNTDINGLYPIYSEASSFGVGQGDFNFGQRHFQGDSKGYKAYDPDYNKDLWINGTIHSGNFIRPNNLNSARYLKSYTSGQYYFEVTIGGSASADWIGMGENSNEQLNVGIGGIGFYFPYLEKKNNKTNRERWSNNVSVETGDIVQVYLDFDHNRFLAKKLGTDKNDYIDIKNNY
jgi:hypothetical protein